MNLILLEAHQQTESGSNFYLLSERQQDHLTKVMKAEVGDSLKVGLLNGSMGEAIYQGLNEANRGLLEIQHLDYPAPKSLAITLILALPRPNMLKRTLLTISAMGIKKLIIINSAKVEKSYWQSPVLKLDNIHQILLEGLEQSRDTILPKIEMMPRFRPYVEDILPLEKQNKRGLLAHPYQAKPCPINVKEELMLAIGPEGGWNEFEVSKWQEAGFESVHLGERILKVETAVPVLLSRLSPL